MDKEWFTVSTGKQWPTIHIWWLGEEKNTLLYFSKTAAKGENQVQREKLHKL